MMRKSMWLLRTCLQLNKGGENTRMYDEEEFVDDVRAESFRTRFMFLIPHCTN